MPVNNTSLTSKTFPHDLFLALGHAYRKIEGNFYVNSLLEHYMTPV